MSLLLIGPTLSEFEIIDRRAIELCPAGSLVLTHDGVGPLVGGG